jgi:hypothetical protein
LRDPAYVIANAEEILIGEKNKLASVFLSINFFNSSNENSLLPITAELFSWQKL